MLPLLSIRFLLTASLATLIAVWGYQWLPSKRMTVYPGAVGQLHVFYDGQGDGASRAHFDPATRVAVCEMIPSDAYPFCGVIASLGDGISQGLDFSRYEGMNVTVRYTGPSSRLRVSVRNFEPGFSKAGRVETAKFQSFNVPVDDLAKTAHIRLADLAVADWWIAESGVPREMSQPNFSNVIRFGFDLPDPVAYGRHEIEVVGFELVGNWVTEKQWYLGILLFWFFVVALMFARQNLRAKRKLDRDRAFLKALAAPGDNSHSPTRDGLTGALSRAGLAQVASHYHDAEGRNTRRYALALFEVEGFGKINGHLGYDAAGELLVSVAQLVRERARGSDLLCRWEDDRFALFSPDAGAEELLTTAQAIRTRISEQKFSIGGKAVKITVGIGVGESSEHKRFDQTFQAVNQALIAARAMGKGQVRQASK